MSHRIAPLSLSAVVDTKTFVSPLLEFRDQSNTANEKQAAQSTPDIERMMIHPEESEVIDCERGQQRSCDGESHEWAGTNLIHKIQPGIDLH
jgi:hypothetical protein